MYIRNPLIIADEVDSNEVFVIDIPKLLRNLAEAVTIFTLSSDP